MLSIQLLGDPLLRGPDGPITGRAAYRRRIALLSILAAARGRPVGRERLVGLLWAEHTTEAARHTLSESLYVLRKELGEAAFVVVGDEVGLNREHARSDLDQFETALEEGRTEDAVRLYGGPFLDGFFVPGALEFERWAEGERDRLARVFAGALEQLAERAEAAGRPLDAAGWWRKLAAHDPFSSRVALRLAQALRDGGEHAAALRHAESHAALLHAELGVGPNAELAAFVARLRADGVPLLPRPAAPPAPSIAAEPGVHTGAAGPAGTAGDEAPPAREAIARAGDAARASEEAAAEEVEPARAGPGERDSVVAVPRAGLHPAEPASRVAAAPPRPASKSRWGRVLSTTGGVLALGAALIALNGTGRGGPPAPAGPDPRRIAVLYFDDHSRGGELGYLASGLTESLIHELSQVRALTVISRNGVKPYRGGTVPLDSVAARLGVGSVVEGSVQRSGDRVQVTVQLIDAATQSPVESRVVVRPLGDVLALERALAEEVGGFLRRRLGRQVQLRALDAGTRSSLARALVLRASDAMDQAGDLAESRDSLDQLSSRRLSQRADSLLAAAHEADPGWTLPLALRARNALEVAARVPPGEQPALLRQADHHAAAVLRREPRDAQALYVRGAATRWRGAGLGRGEDARLDAAERDLRAAVAADSSLAPAWGALAQLLLSRGRVAEARLAAERALAADAWLEDAGRLLRRIYFAALGEADYATAWDACLHGARAFPGDWHFVECRLTLLREDGSRSANPALAWALVDELERLDPPARARAAGRGYARIYRRMVAAAVSARAGEGSRARAELARARAETHGDTTLGIPLAYDEAYVLWVLGDSAAARERLRAYLAARPGMRSYLARDPLFQELYAVSAANPSGSR